MRRWLRWWQFCRKGQHRDTLDAEPMPGLVIITAHFLNWRCVDCGRTYTFACSDDVRELHREGRHTPHD